MLQLQTREPLSQEAGVGFLFHLLVASVFIMFVALFDHDEVIMLSCLLFIIFELGGACS